MFEVKSFSQFIAVYIRLRGSCSRPLLNLPSHLLPPSNHHDGNGKSNFVREPWPILATPSFGSCYYCLLPGLLPSWHQAFGFSFSPLKPVLASFETVTIVLKDSLPGPVKSVRQFQAARPAAPSRENSNSGADSTEIVRRKMSENSLLQ